ncbi:MAG: hypothetical protein J7M08_06860, partial [Planctomycetes bacterium]|nr:hypothetical protein [Planctomycetota bacterium]
MVPVQQTILTQAMMMPHAKLSEMLAELDRQLGVLDEHDVAIAVRALRDKDDASEPSLEWRAETMAFAFMEN